MKNFVEKMILVANAAKITGKENYSIANAAVAIVVSAKMHGPWTGLENLEFFWVADDPAAAPGSTSKYDLAGLRAGSAGPSTVLPPTVLHPLTAIDVLKSSAWHDRVYDSKDDRGEAAIDTIGIGPVLPEEGDLADYIYQATKQWLEEVGSWLVDGPALFLAAVNELALVLYDRGEYVETEAQLLLRNFAGRVEEEVEVAYLQEAALRVPELGRELLGGSREAAETLIKLGAAAAPALAEVLAVVGDPAGKDCWLQCYACNIAGNVGTEPALKALEAVVEAAAAKDRDREHYVTPRFISPTEVVDWATSHDDVVTVAAINVLVEVGRRQKEEFVYLLQRMEKVGNSIARDILRRWGCLK